MEKKFTNQRPDWEAEYVNLKLSRSNVNQLKKFIRNVDNFIDVNTHPRSVNSTSDILSCIDLIIDFDTLGSEILVIGCGPAPGTVVELDSCGYTAMGIEPVEDALQQAREYLGDSSKVIKGEAESIPLEDCSQVIVLMENVLEHVDSIQESLREAYRILKPGGVLFIRTTNRSRFSITGVNWEFTTRFYNLFPRIVKESYVFSQLHYRPELARYSPRPAVHWFNFPDLCEHGREVGFSRFYSPYDLLYLTRESAKSNSARFRFSHWCRRQPWIRGLVISQMSGDIFMWKKHDLNHLRDSSS